VRALACAASLKGVLGATEASEALGAGLRAGGAEVVELPVADGGEGTAEVLCRARGGTWHEADAVDAFGGSRRARWLTLPDGTAVVEAAAAVPLDPGRLAPLTASSRGFGVLVEAALAARPSALVLCLGGTATMDGGAGLRDVVRDLTVPTRALCDVRTRLLDAPRLFGPQKGASPEQVAELEQRLAAMHDLAPFAGLAGSGAAGGLGAAFAALGAMLVPGAPAVLDLLGLDPIGFDLVVTAEGKVDRTTREGKAPAEIARRCADAGVRCVVAGGTVASDVEGAETVALSGDPARARQDLAALGRALAAEKL
jgi:glycerate 2-kinase